MSKMGLAEQLLEEQRVRKLKIRIPAGEFRTPFERQSDLREIGAIPLRTDDDGDRDGDEATASRRIANYISRLSPSPVRPPVRRGQMSERSRRD